MAEILRSTALNPKVLSSQRQRDLVVGKVVGRGDRGRMPWLCLSRASMEDGDHFWAQCISELALWYFTQHRLMREGRQ